MAESSNCAYQTASRQHANFFAATDSSMNLSFLKTIPLQGCTTKQCLKAGFFVADKGILAMILLP